MVTYIYFVKCPGCEDEHFDFFDNAKEYAMSCLSQKPVITQTEVCRNDFGECTDSCDLGTVWSWEDMMGDLDTEDTKFSKAETFGISEGIDDFDDFDIGPQSDEFAEIDNSVDFEIEDDELPLEECIREQLTEATTTEIDEIFKLCREIGIVTGTDLKAFIKEVGGGNLLAKLREYRAELGPEFKLKEFTERKPVPEGMTIEQLKETMEENEETVECTVCEELFPKADGVKHEHGYICPTCNAETTEAPEVEDADIDPFNQEYPDVESEEDVFDDDFSAVDAGRAVADLVVDEFEAISGYDFAAEIVENSEISEEKQEEILDVLDHIREEEVEHIEELKEISTEDKEAEVPAKDEVLEEATSEETIQCAGCEQMFPKDECFEKEGIGYLCGDCEDRIVKCTWCDDLYDKGECRYEVDLGWLCDRCEAAIKSRGETLTFREGNYWDFLDEAATKANWSKAGPKLFKLTTDKGTAEVYQNTHGIFELSVRDKSGKYLVGGNMRIGGSTVPEDETHKTKAAAMKAAEKYLVEDFSDAETNSLAVIVKDSINHLTNDLGKDPCAEDFVDDVIKDIENNYDVDVPTNPKQYSYFCDAVAKEVSFQLNTSDDDIDFDNVFNMEF